MADGPHSTLLETVRIRDGAAPLWYLHVRRLVASCQALGIPFPPALDTPAGGRDRVHRLAVNRAGAGVVEREVGPDAPVRLVTSSLIHPGYRHKTTEREVFTRAAEAARKAGADDALLLSGAGEVAEASIWCVFWWEGERVVAPALEIGILPGVSRMRIEELLGPLDSRRVPREELAGRSLFLANAVRGIVEVAALDGVVVPPDPRTGALRARFWP
jgi:4-amino-4-deoxychorismate lyase